MALFRQRRVPRLVAIDSGWRLLLPVTPVSMRSEAFAHIVFLSNIGPVLAPDVESGQCNRRYVELPFPIYRRSDEHRMVSLSLPRE